MILKNLLTGLHVKNPITEASLEQHIRGVADNSQDVQADILFIALSGHNQDGHSYIEDAIKKGASVVLGEKDLTNLPVPYLQVENSRKALGIIAKNFYGNPAKQKLMIGITGTNGKTTTSYLLRHILETNNISCTVFGTIENIVNGESIKSSHTTSNPLILQQLLTMSQDEAVIMEVSSHGLDQHRIEGIEFDFCLFTNLHHEHLDYHETIEHYFQAKKSLFGHLKAEGKAIINTESIWGEKLGKELKMEGIPTYTIGRSGKNDFETFNFNCKKFTACIRQNQQIEEVSSPMPGIHNMENTLMAYVTSRILGIEKKDILAALGQFPGVDGRFELTKTENDVSILIDYAHTPDAVLHLLTTVKQLGAKRIIHIFGFRGNRDSSKWPEMLFQSSQLSDRYILTMDDLNSMSYVEMLTTLQSLNKEYGNQKGYIVPDRTCAIKLAIEQGCLGDYIVITGKGHEMYQQTYQLETQSDRETVNHLLKGY